MARSPLTLAAMVTTATAKTEIISAASLVDESLGEVSAALLETRDGKQLIVQLSETPDAALSLSQEAHALKCLSTGSRAVLSFAVPELIASETIVPAGETQQNAQLLLTSFIPGYRVLPENVPADSGVAAALGRAIAEIHNLPRNIVLDNHLVSSDATASRNRVRALLARASDTGRVPHQLLERWRDAVDTDELWQFESTSCLGGIDSDYFLLREEDESSVVVGLSNWRGLAIGDPAQDLRWIHQSNGASAFVLKAYADTTAHRVDFHISDRARLYAEFEYLRWLQHAMALKDQELIADAVVLLESLAEQLGSGSLISASETSLDSVREVIDTTPEFSQEATDTSMQTDTYDPAKLGAYLADPADGQSAELSGVDLSGFVEQVSAYSDVETGAASESENN